MMPGPIGRIRAPLSRKCCGPISTNTTYICEKCKRRPCCQMNYLPVCNCCLAKHKLKICCSFERIACAHRTHSEVILPNHELVDGTENEEIQEKRIDKSKRNEGNGREEQLEKISIDNTEIPVNTISEENNSIVNEFNWNENKLHTQTFERNSKLIETYEYKVIKPPPKVWNICEGKSTSPKICYKTEWYLENTKEFLPSNSCECELCMKERSQNNSMNAFKNCFRCCKKEKTVYTRYRKVPLPDFSESEDEKIGEKLKKKMGGGKSYRRKRNRR